MRGDRRQESSTHERVENCLLPHLFCSQEHHEQSGANPQGNIKHDECLIKHSSCPSFLLEMRLSEVSFFFSGKFWFSSARR